MIFQSHTKLLEQVNEKAFELEVLKLFSERAFSYVFLYWFIRKLDPERNNVFFMNINICILHILGTSIFP